MVDTAKQMICRTATTFLYLVLTFAMSSPAVAGQLLGHKGDRLKGSISCIHPNIIRDLSDRIGEEENYTTVARLYVQHGYCIEADLPTILRKPLADRIGNHRSGTFLNVLENPSIGLLFIVPKRREVVRVSGVAQAIGDPELLKAMAIDAKVPELALFVRVREAFFHCGKSMIRSGMWEPDRWGSIDGLPTHAQALKDHAKMPGPLPDLERGVALNERDRLY